MGRGEDEENHPLPHNPSFNNPVEGAFWKH